jgi:hypothetical protein
MSNTELAMESVTALMDQATKLINDELPKDKNLKLLAWEEVSRALKKLKVVEKTLRDECVDAHYHDIALKEGVNAKDLGNGWKLKAKVTMRRKIDESAIEGVFEKLPNVAKSDLINFKPELKLSAYRKLSTSDQRIFDELLTTVQGSTALELLPPH